jgi:aspartyl-tRNA(Asn)/glutamyl-tRNA(Gln) amidotransferase subunit C
MVMNALPFDSITPMPAFTPDDVDRIAELARLALTDDERVLFARQLADILAYAEQIQKVDTSGIAPMSHVCASAESLRDDQERPGLPREDALAAGPDADRQAGLFKVPRVLGG